MIDNQFFVCYSESPSFVTYRARLEWTRETESDSLISLIEEWVRGGVSVNVTGGVLMTVDPHCSVAISSPDQPECSLATSSSTTAPVSDAVIGGVVAVVIVTVIAVTIAVIIIVFLVLKNRHGEVSLKKYDKEH